MAVIAADIIDGDCLCCEVSRYYPFLTFVLIFDSAYFLSSLGNKAFAAKDYDEAIKHYTAAISIDSKNCVYFSNRR